MHLQFLNGDENTIDCSLTCIFFPLSGVNENITYCHEILSVMENRGFSRLTTWKGNVEVLFLSGYRVCSKQVLSRN